MVPWLRSPTWASPSFTQVSQGRPLLEGQMRNVSSLLHSLAGGLSSLRAGSLPPRHHSDTPFRLLVIF